MIFIIIPLQLGNMYLECGEWQKVGRSLKLYLSNVYFIVCMSSLWQAVSVLTMVISLLRISKVEEESSSIIELSLKVAKAYANMKQYVRAMDRDN